LMIGVVSAVKKPRLPPIIISRDAVERR
jgi:hypothetical protein